MYTEWISYNKRFVDRNKFNAPTNGERRKEIHLSHPTAKNIL